MSRTQEVNYPPDELFSQTGFERPNIEHVILWMLQNNDTVEWSNFKEEPISIPQSTLSYYLKSLILDEYVEKVSRGVYQITPKGEERYNNLSRVKSDERKLNYPPDAILSERNYDHWILWMVYNNTYCKWSDFVEEPLRINQSSLSKNLNELRKREVIRKENKEYRITQKGKSEYSRMLKLYDLDRQSILNEESKRIEEITRKTIRFFEKYNIQDGDIKFRFLNNILKLPYSNLKGSLDSEEDFNKVLLFLSMNHPNQYPFYISPEQFSKEYYINLLELKFNIRQIVEKEIYTTKFFCLEVKDDKIYYFQAGEKLEKILSAITEDHITKFTYLKKLYQNTPSRVPSLSLSYTVDAILEEICDNLFNEGIKESLKKFLPDYIKYLAYRIETERRLVDTLDKLEGVAWRDIPEVFQSYSSRYGQAQFKYSVDYTVLKVLKLFESPEIESMFEELMHLMKKRALDNALDQLESKIDEDPENLNLIFLKSIVLSVSNRHNEAIHFLKDTFRNHPNKNEEEIFIPYNYILIYCYMVLDKFDKALKLSAKISKIYPEHPISFVSKALIQGTKIIYQLEKSDLRTDQVFLDIDHAISLEENKKNIAKYYYIKSLTLMHLKKYDDALEAINFALELDLKDINLHYVKNKVLYEYGKIDEALASVEEALKLFPDKAEKIMIHKAYLYKKHKNYDKSLEIIDKLFEKNPNDIDILNNKLYYHIYKHEKEEALKAGEMLIKLDPEDGNCYDSYAEALVEFGNYEKAIEIAKKALELEPLGWFTYNTYFQLAKGYKETGEYELAKDSLQKGERATNTCFCGIEMRNEWKGKKLDLLAEIQSLETKA
jgi:predicted Zn-dependent protease/predicted transcriptional regulator